ncbi:unnamed protein product [Triticum turgidum subsp. durum]|uniref:ELMO domain-containing protein n=1 Tax=Triticum turgidum subsp. durum TaxID=4567 RepID=A0A9R1P103_TRITD|nr:unnamed protein product [Triticum turgidum subsp. durum]
MEPVGLGSKQEYLYDCYTLSLIEKSYDSGHGTEIRRKTNWVQLNPHGEAEKQSASDDEWNHGSSSGTVDLPAHEYFDLKKSDVLDEDVMIEEPGIVFFEDGSYSRGPLDIEIGEYDESKYFLSPTYQFEQSLVKGCHKRLRIVHTIEFSEGGANIQTVRVAVYEEKWASPANIHVEDNTPVDVSPFSQRKRTKPSELTGPWKVYEVSATPIFSEKVKEIEGGAAFVYLCMETMKKRSLPESSVFFGEEEMLDMQDVTILWLPGGVTAYVDVDKDGILCIGVSWYSEEGINLVMERDYGTDGKLREVRTKTEIKRRIVQFRMVNLGHLLHIVLYLDLGFLGDKIYDHGITVYKNVSHQALPCASLIAGEQGWTWTMVMTGGADVGGPALEDATKEECLQRLQNRIEVPYDSQNREHQEALKALWHASFPGTELLGLVSDQWKEMGWQGKDPSTDFRGGGFISLENLLYFAKNYPKSFEELLCKQNGDRALWEYPFAVAGVNITFMLIQMLDLQAENDRAFDILYCITFKLMDRKWLEMHATYMDFNSNWLPEQQLGHASACRMYFRKQFVLARSLRARKYYVNETLGAGLDFIVDSREAFMHVRDVSLRTSALEPHSSLHQTPNFARRREILTSSSQGDDMSLPEAPSTTSRWTNSRMIEAPKTISKKKRPEDNLQEEASTFTRAPHLPD